MTELLTAAQMRAIEQAAIDAGEVTGLELMERAGQGVVDAIMDWRPDFREYDDGWRRRRAIVLCGPGNNGGDGFVIARLLHERDWDVRVFLYGRDPADIDKLPADAALNARRWAALGTVRRFGDWGAPIWTADIIVDALFGAGLTRPLDQQLLTACHDLHNADDEVLVGAPEGRGFAPPEMLVVAVDCLSGLCMDSGRTLGDRTAFFGADLTVTFHAARPGHCLAQGIYRSGRQVPPVHLGLWRDPWAERIDVRGSATILRLIDRETMTPHPDRSLTKSSVANKYSHGHVLVLSGGVGRGGAARLAARGALRVGAGLVTVGCPPAAVMENACRLDAVMLRAVDGAKGFLAFEGLGKVSAVCLGPGFGVGEACRAMVSAVLSNDEVEPHPTGWDVVLDADALTSFEGEPSVLFGMLHERCVLTPHMGEFRRLFPDIAA
ncbi:MAG: NAD(P)H-hydrate epimerase, partial [Pseudomonadota bacterium]